MHFRPLHDRVVVRRTNAEEKTAGGIIVPDTAKEKPQEGEVIGAGPGARNERGEELKRVRAVPEPVLPHRYLTVPTPMTARQGEARRPRAVV